MPPETLQLSYFPRVRPNRRRQPQRPLRALMIGFLILLILSLLIVLTGGTSRPMCVA